MKQEVGFSKSAFGVNGVAVEMCCFRKAVAQKCGRRLCLSTFCSISRTKKQFCLCLNFFVNYR